MGDLLQPEHLYNEKYLLGEKIGSGGFGSVYIVTRGSTGEILASKHIKSRGREKKMKARSEVEILSGLDCQFIIKFVEAFDCVDKTVLVMEYLTGGELFERVVDEESESTESDCCLYMRQILMGVEYLHLRNIVHLDIKPENIMCTDKESKNVKIVDFGTALQLEPGKKVQNMAGTFEFMAPEIVNSETIYTGSDMWSVGVLCFVLLSGYSPFLDDNDSATLSNVTTAKYNFDYEEFDTISSDSKDFITRLLRKTPTRRMSASDCLKHAWLEENKIKKKTGRINIGNIREFLARRKVQNVVRAFQVINVLKENVKERNVERQSSKSGSSYISEYTTKASNDPHEFPLSSTDACFDGADELSNEVLEENLSEEETEDQVPELTDSLVTVRPYGFVEKPKRTVTKPIPGTVKNVLNKFQTDGLVGRKYGRTDSTPIPGTVNNMKNKYQKSKRTETKPITGTVKNIFQTTEECQQQDVLDITEEQVPQLPNLPVTEVTDGPTGKYKRTETKPIPGTVQNMKSIFQKRERTNTKPIPGTVKSGIHKFQSS